MADKIEIPAKISIKLKDSKSVGISEQFRLFFELKEGINASNAYWTNLLSSESASKTIKDWALDMQRVFSIFHADIDDYLSNTVRNTTLSTSRYREIAGVKLVRNLLDTINAFEAYTESLRLKFPIFATEINKRITPVLTSLTESWNAPSEIKKPLLSRVAHFETEQSYKRRALKALKVITDSDFDFMEFAWDFRNGMHNNFVALKDIHYTLRDERFGLEVEMTFKKGTTLGLPLHPILILSITDRIAFLGKTIIEALEKTQKQPD
jgi:hypothetical protein